MELKIPMLPTYVLLTVMNAIILSLEVSRMPRGVNLSLVNCGPHKADTSTTKLLQVQSINMNSFLTNIVVHLSIQRVFTSKYSDAIRSITTERDKAKTHIPSHLS